MLIPKYENIERPFIIDSTLENASLEFGTAFYYCLQSFEQDYSKIILLCIGSDRATGDSLGPLIGYKLSGALEEHIDVKIFGTLEKPVHAVNLSYNINRIYEEYKNPLIIAIDACLGNSADIGNLSIHKGYINPGTGVGKSLPLVGDMGITGVVNHNGSMELIILQNTSLNIIMKMADVVSNGIYYGFQLFFSDYYVNAD